MHLLNKLTEEDDTLWSDALFSSVKFFSGCLLLAVLLYNVARMAEEHVQVTAGRENITLSTPAVLPTKEN